ncbi:cytochrome P450 [Brasilonema sp. UFV-L1]|uniref:cytochrome P450 n=1 Tax=Brasilonema sp. UFV-L1 TaxID=2234130 RepID=UPI00145D5CE9|nr:cytochrome P450 [Brasilonema sp. UFV-L1]NMG08930.1 cytochrome P450 [Brasilonema sp. UFV-L1]
MNLPNLIKTPSFFQQIQWVAEPVEYMEKAVQQYPDIFTSGVLGSQRPVIFVQHPQAIAEIFTNDRKKFAALSRENRILQPLLGDNSIVMLDSDRHKRQRQLLIPPFHGERMQAYGEIIRNITEKVFSQLPHNQPVSIRTTMQEISLQVILQAVFGLYEGERCQQIKRLITSVLEVFQSPLGSSFLFFRFLQKDLGAWSPWGRFVRQRQQIDELLYAEIAERRTKSDPNRIDILSLLMSARDEEGKPMTEQELRDELMTLLFAGHDTTATAMAWGLYWLHHLPQVGEKLLQELGNLGDSPNTIDIARLPYLSAVCNETLRIYPVGILTFARVVKEPVKLLEHELEPDTAVCGCIYLLHHRQDLYPQPNQFKPERFLERQFSPYEFMPFGGGARRCIGEALALFEMKLVLATIFSHYQLALTTNQPEQPQRRGVTLAPSGKVKMMITGERKSQESRKVVASV